MLQTLSLSPGVTLRCFRDNRFKQGRLSIQFVRPMCLEEASMNALLPAVLLRGTQKHPDLRSITQYLDDLYGASIGDLVRRIGDYHTTGLYCAFTEDSFALPGDEILKPTVAFLQEILFEPLTEDGLLCPSFVESEGKNLLADLQAQKNDKALYAANRLMATMCRGDSYGIPRLGTAETISQVTPETLTAHYRKVLRESPVEIFYVGSVPAEEMAQLLMPLAQRLGKHAGHMPAQTAFQDCGESHERERLEIAQSRVNLGFVTPITNRDESFAAIQVFNALFGGGMTSKLFMTVREKMSLCYSISSGYYATKGILTVAAGIDGKQEAVVREEILCQLALCREGEISDAELEGARQSLLNGLQGVHDSPGAIENYYATAALSGLNRTPEEYRRQVLAVTREDVVAAAKSLRLHASFFLEGLCN